MKIIFIDFATSSPVLTMNSDSLSAPPIPRKGEPVYLGARHKQLVKYVRWVYEDVKIYPDDGPPVVAPGLTFPEAPKPARLDRIEIILE